ncbi:MAG: rhodanese-like domain-containing protein [Runella sp.]
MKRIILSIYFSMMLFGKSSAQSAKVESGAYSVLLKTLLSHSVPEADVQKLKKTSEPLVWVDAREQREYEVSHLPNAVWVGYDKLDLAPLEKLPKNQPIVVYCSVGYRSEKVAEKLIKQGFTNVQNLYGGIFEWKNQGGEVVNAKGKTDDVHAYNKTWGVWLKKGNKVYE